MEPRIGDAYLDTPDEDPETATVYTVNGVASVSVNSGTDPGPIRVEATCDCDQDGTVDLTTVDVPVIIASGAPYHIEAEYDPNATEAIGGGFYQTECSNPDTEEWHPVTRRETIESAEAAIDGSIEHYTKKLEFVKGPKVVKTFE